jgi:hypothetical protein
MSEQSPYQLLGVTEDASFEAVQAARVRLTRQYTGDQRRTQMIETAYDAILMERLRMRQEGKIKVPEGIRFPERVAPLPPSFPTPSINSSPAWLQKLIDTPSIPDILWPAGVFLGLSGLSLYPATSDSVLQLTLALGVGASLYFLNRKEKKFGRAVLLTVAGLITGLLLGGLIASGIAIPMLTAEKFITLVTFLILWLVSSFLK